MSAVVEPPVAASRTIATLHLVDAENPWLGLDSFTEETRGFFHGREEEIGELARRVQRKLLAVLFGQSGLGKTSILRAGIVPRLRREGYCPVYVRIDYSPESPPPSEQIKLAIFRATETQGRWSRPGTATQGESLWEFLHHRDDVLRDESGKTVTPLLIFDQFEEIFTLGQDDDFGRKRAAEFIEDLADLVENRPPRALESRLDADDTIVERFDFSRADYRILIALREDYLAHLEGLKSKMPSITQNRMRLARMTGEQALAAVMKPGGRLVSEEVAEAIVRFIAGGAELRNAEVEPSLLSLVCRELNNARIAQKRAEISADLLAGSRDTILNEFYERSLADQPAGVRRFIEDEMLTESAFRESLAEERVQKAFAAAGAPPGALAVLVNRRLLRIEERLDVRRVELTHDVLCAVVKESRDLRHEREARDEAERQLLAQREREAATHRALVRARKIAAGCAVLALVALAGAIFGWVNMQRARDAEAKAQQTRVMAEAARGEAEKLIVYLIDDFYLELEPVGRLDIVAALSRRALDYYAALPQELRTRETDRNRALAQARFGHVLRYQGKTDEGEKVLTDATQVLARLRREGDTSEASAIGLGLGLSALARVRDSQNKPVEASRDAREAVAALEPLMKTGSPSVALRRAYGGANLYLGFQEMRREQEEEGVRHLEVAREAYRGISGLRPDDPTSAIPYTEATSWQVEALMRLGRYAEARSRGEDAARIAKAVLDVRPGHMGAIRAYGLLSAVLGAIEVTEFRTRRALPLLREGERAWETFLKLDAGNNIAWNNLSADRGQIAFTLESLGRLEEARSMWRAASSVERNAPMTSSLAGGLIFSRARSAVLAADFGHSEEAAAEAREYHRLAELAVRGLPAKSFVHMGILEFANRFDYVNAFLLEDYARARELAEAAALRIEAAQPTEKDQVIGRQQALAFNYYYLAATWLELKDLDKAEAAARKAVENRKPTPVIGYFEQLESSRERILLALILARRGKTADALALAEPEIKAHRALLPRSDDLIQHTLLVRALQAAAAASPAQAPTLLAEANRVLDGYPKEMSRRRSFQKLRASIAEDLATR
jgi:hypothetical protein